MFEPLPEKPPHMAGHWIVLIACGGGVVGAMVALWLFGEERFQSNTIMFGSFGLGALVGLVAAWRLIVPRAPRSSD